MGFRISNMTRQHCRLTISIHIAFPNLNWKNTQICTYKNTTFSKDLTCAIFLKCLGFKDIKYDCHIMTLQCRETWDMVCPPIQLVPKLRTICWRIISGSSAGCSRISNMTFSCAIKVMKVMRISLHICISMHVSKFLCISLHFTSFLCIFLHFSAFLWIFLHFSAFLCILHLMFWDNLTERTVVLWTPFVLNIYIYI